MGPRGAADAVDVVLEGAGQVVVHDVAHAGDVDPAGGDVRGHQHPVGAAAEPGQGILPRGLAAVSVDALHAVAGRAHGPAPPQHIDGRLGLEGQLARGRQDQGPGARGPGQALDEGDHEGGRLACARLGAAHHISALEGGGDGQGLDRGGGRVAGGADILQDLRREPQPREGGGGLGFQDLHSWSWCGRPGTPAPGRAAGQKTKKRPRAIGPRGVILVLGSAGNGIYYRVQSSACQARPHAAAASRGNSFDAGGKEAYHAIVVRGAGGPAPSDMCGLEFRLGWAQANRPPGTARERGVGPRGARYAICRAVLS
jgi:hypothetical protein